MGEGYHRWGYQASDDPMIIDQSDDGNAGDGVKIIKEGNL